MMLRVCIYARYSTDLQNDKSNDNQIRELREDFPNLARQLGVQPSDLIEVAAEQDAAKSGATIFQRAGLRRIRRAAASGEFDILLTETPNRLARKVGEMGLLYDELRYHRVRWFTKTMGEMDPVKAGMMAAISQQNLEEGKYFTRRGLRGCIEDGRSAGGLSFGYSLDKDQTRVNRRGQVEKLKGVLVIHLEQAAIVVRIFRLYVAGLSAKAIARLLNKEGIRGPRGRLWKHSTIRGNPETGVGILNNELYRGRLVHGRREYRMNPQTGLRGKAIMNPESALKVKDVPHLRIIDDDLWQAVKARQAATRRAQRTGIDKARRPKFLFSKLTKCGICDGGFTTESRDELRCNNYHAGPDSICTNNRVIKRKEVELRVLAALQRRFLTRERLDKFTRTYVAETNRIRAEHQQKMADARRELERIDRRQMQILGYLNGGFGEVESWKVEVRQNELRRAELQALVTAATSEPKPPALHPNMATVFEQKIRTLAAALEHEDLETRESARSALRGFIDRIVISPGDALLRVVGNLGEMLTAAGAPREAAVVGNSGCGGGI